MLKNIERIQKLSILHCVYQLIASADGSINEERDETAIALVLSELGFESIHAWDSALKLNPHDCFWHVSTLNENDKLLTKDILLKIVKLGGNTTLRETCANHLFQFCSI